MTMTSQSPSVSRPLGRRTWFSEAVLKTALARIIRNGTMTLRLPDGRSLSFGSGSGPEHIVVAADNAVLYAADADPGNVLELSLNDGSVLRSFVIGGELHGLDLSDNRTTSFIAGRGKVKIAAFALSTGTIAFARLSPEPYRLTNVPGTGTFFVSSRAEPKVWIVDEITLAAVKEFPVEGETHQMTTIDRDTDGSTHE
uniref:YncE family protein n=1 Tax=Pararhizobium sp. IMCC3301 TaxID=3067904 RepID=UPI0027404367|nr:hypothetical protein [Pararhizobium sp. IMCC3301]